MAAALVALPIVKVLPLLLPVLVNLIWKPLFTLLLKVSERTVLALDKTLIVWLAGLKFLKRRSASALKVGKDPSQLFPDSQLPVAAPPFHVVPAEA
jgi:hypothetical protein